MSNDDSSDVGSKMDVSFDVNVMTDADDGGVAYLLDSYFPDNTGILERDPLNAAVRAADSTSILKLAAEDEEEGEVGGAKDKLDVYGVMSLICIAKTSTLAPMFAKFFKSSGASQIAFFLEKMAGPYHIFISDRVSFLPIELAAQVVVHTFEELVATPPLTHVVVLLKARTLAPVSAPSAKKTKRTREEAPSPVAAVTSAPTWEFLKPEDDLFYKHRDVSFGEVRMAFAREYEDQPAAEIPFAIPVVIKASSIAAIVTEVKSLDAYFAPK